MNKKPILKLIFLGTRSIELNKRPYRRFYLVEAVENTLAFNPGQEIDETEVREAYNKGYIIKIRRGEEE